MEFDKDKTYFFWVGNNQKLSKELQDFFFKNGFCWRYEGKKYVRLNAYGLSIHEGRTIMCSHCATINEWKDSHKNCYKNPVFITDSFDVLDDGSF